MRVCWASDISIFHLDITDQHFIDISHSSTTCNNPMNFICSMVSLPTIQSERLWMRPCTIDMHASWSAYWNLCLLVSKCNTIIMYVEYRCGYSLFIYVNRKGVCLCCIGNASSSDQYICIIIFLFFIYIVHLYWLHWKAYRNWDDNTNEWLREFYRFAIV